MINSIQKLEKDSFALEQASMSRLKNSLHCEIICSTYWLAASWSPILHIHVSQSAFKTFKDVTGVEILIHCTCIQFYAA